MVNQGIKDYLSKLSESLLALEITDRGGCVLPLDEGINKAVDMILSVKKNFHKVMLIGNGGSASIASHAQNDLCKAVGVQAMVFNEPPLLTALSNDHGYESVFERLVKLWACEGDLLIAISSSGESENILRAVHLSLTQKCNVATFSGFSARNPLRKLGHLNFYVPAQSYGYIETAHSILAHFLTDSAMKRAFSKNRGLSKPK